MIGAARRVKSLTFISYVAELECCRVDCRFAQSRAKASRLCMRESKSSSSSKSSTKDDTYILNSHSPPYDDISQYISLSPSFLCLRTRALKLTMCILYSSNTAHTKNQLPTSLPHSSEVDFFPSFFRSMRKMRSSLAEQLWAFWTKREGFFDHIGRRASGAKLKLWSKSNTQQRELAMIIEEKRAIFIHDDDDDDFFRLCRRAERDDESELFFGSYSRAEQLTRKNRKAETLARGSSRRKIIKYFTSVLWSIWSSSRVWIVALVWWGNKCVKKKFKVILFFLEFKKAEEKAQKNVWEKCEMAMGRAWKSHNCCTVTIAEKTSERAKTKKKKKKCFEVRRDCELRIYSFSFYSGDRWLRACVCMRARLLSMTATHSREP